MIQEHFNMTLTDKLTMVGQVLGKVAVNFWPVIVIAVVGAVVLAHQESRSK